MAHSGRPHGLAAGDRVGNLVVERPLGSGGFASVWLARDEVLGRRVALKVLDPPEGEGAVRYREAVLAEARALGAIQSPCVVTVHQVRELPDGRLTFEMEYVEGGSLADLLAAHGALPPERVVPVVRDVLRGLGAAHRAGVLHRDVKPGNVLLTADGTAKLADFGLAREFGEIALRSSQEGRLVGTPVYMAPETLLRAPPTKATDLWSVGVLAHEMLAGVPPFDARDLQAFFRAVLNDAPDRLPDSVPTPLRAFVTRCLAKRPEDRPATCDEALAILEEGVREAPAERAASRTGLDVVARDAEIARLSAVLERAGTGRLGAALVSGPAGIGKSTLLRTAHRLAAQRGFRRLAVALAPQEAPVASVLRALRTFARSRTDEATTASLAAAAGPRGSRYLSGEELPELARTDEAVSLAESLVRALAAKGPVLITLDDVRPGSAEDAAALAALASRLEDGAVALVVAHSTDDPLANRVAVAPGVERIELGPLAAADVYEVLLRSAQVARIDAESVRQIADRSAGNPFLAIQLVAHLEASGALVRRGSELVATGRAPLDALPGAVRDVVTERLAALPSDQQEVLEIAAADGVDFDGQAVAAVLGVPLLGVLRTLQRVCAAGGLAAPGAVGYRFESPLVREALLQRLAPEMRSALHRALAEHLESRTAPVDPERLAVHWAGCGEPGRALPHAIRAAESAVARFDVRRAWSILRTVGLTGATLEPDLAYGHSDLFLQLMSGLQERSLVAEGEAIGDVLRRAAEAAGDRRVALRVEFQQCVGRLAHTGVRPLDETVFRRCIDEFPETRLAHEAHYALALLAKRQGRFDEAETHLRAIVDLSAAGADEFGLSRALDQLGSIERRRGRYSEAESLYRESAAIATRLGRPVLAAMRTVNQATCAIVAGKVDDVEAPLARAIHVLELGGSTALAEQARINLAEVRAALGDVAGAERILGEAIPILRSASRWIALSAALTLLAAVVATRGATTDALAALDEAADLERKAPDSGLSVQILVARARVEALAGDRDAATASCVAALRAAAHSSEAADSVVGGIALAAFYGADGRVLDDAVRVLRFRTSAPPDDGSPASWGLWLAVRALRTSDADGLSRAAAVLRGPRIGSLRAELRAIGSWLESEAARLRGDDARRALTATQLVAEARLLGHVGLEERARRLS